jgi:PAS domain S-box-containing protein
MLKILIVDDEKSIRLTLGKFLSEAGHEVQAAEDAPAGLALLRQQTFDLVLSDIVLPRTNGMEMLKVIRAEDPEIPVVMMTGEPTLETAVEAVRAGAFDYLSKPINKAGILRVVEQVTRLRTLQLEKARLEEANRQYRQNLEQMVTERTGTLREQARLLDLAHDAIVVLDMEGGVRYWNQSCERLTGHTAADARGRPLVELLQTDSGTCQAARQVVAETGQWNGELRLSTDKGALTVLSRWTLVRDEHGLPQSVLVINTDITEQKKIEARFLRAQRLDSVGQLAGGGRP